MIYFLNSSENLERPSSSTLIRLIAFCFLCRLQLLVRSPGYPHNMQSFNLYLHCLSWDVHLPLGPICECSTLPRIIGSPPRGTALAPEPSQCIGDIWDFMARLRRLYLERRSMSSQITHSIQSVEYWSKVFVCAYHNMILYRTSFLSKPYLVYVRWEFYYLFYLKDYVCVRILIEEYQMQNSPAWYSWENCEPLLLCWSFYTRGRVHPTCYPELHN